MTDAGAPAPGAAWRRPGIALAAILAAGAALRLYSYCANPSFSVDEAMLALNLGARSFAGLLRPLAFEQTAPPLFLWAERVAVLLGGVHERALRALPLAAGLLLPWLVWRLARRVAGTGPALTAAAFAALSPILVQYSVTAKPYLTDAVITALLAGWTLDVIDRPADRGAWWRLAAAGLVSLAASTPAVFVLAGAGGALLAAPAVRRAPGAAWRIAVGGAVWLAGFAALYFGILRAEATSPYMQWFWEAKFVAQPGVPVARHLWDVLNRLPVEPFVGARALAPTLVLLWGAAVWGAWRIARRGRAAAPAVLVPVAAVLVASVLRRYPISPRVMLFAAPLFFLLFAVAIEDAAERWPAGLGAGARRAIVALWLVALAGIALNTRWWGPDLRPLVREFARRAGPAEPVWVYAGAIPAWTAYTTDWDRPDTAALDLVFATGGAHGAAFHNAPSRGRAVADTEGADLHVRTAGREELLGLAPGMRWREGFGWSADRPDSGWAGREAARIRAAADSTAWLVVAHSYPTATGPLFAALEAAGARTVSERAARGATLYRVAFPRTLTR